MKKKRDKGHYFFLRFYLFIFREREGEREGEKHPCVVDILKYTHFSPGWCGSMDGVLACVPKGHRFHSQSGHKPGLWAKPPVGGAQEATTYGCFSSSLPPSLPLSLKINKIFESIQTHFMKGRFFHTNFSL